MCRRPWPHLGAPPLSSVKATSHDITTVPLLYCSPKTKEPSGQLQADPGVTTVNDTICPTVITEVAEGQTNSSKHHIDVVQRLSSFARTTHQYSLENWSVNYLHFKKTSHEQPRGHTSNFHLVCFQFSFTRFWDILQDGIQPAWGKKTTTLWLDSKNVSNTDDGWNMATF